MKLSPSGTFTAVGWDAIQSQWVVAYQQFDTLQIRTFRPDLSEVMTTVVRIGPDAAAFPKFDEGYLAYRAGGPDFLIIVRNIAGDYSRTYGTGFGNDPVVLGGPIPYYQGTATFRVRKGAGSYVREGAPTGLSRYVAQGNKVYLIDEDRLAIPGYTRPCWAGNAVAVEGATLEAVVFDNTGKEAHVFVGEEAFTPSLAFNGTDYLIGTWGKEGIRIQLLQPADFKLPVPPVDSPPPVDPPVDPVPPVPPVNPPPMSLTPAQIRTSAQRLPWDFDVQFLEVYRQGVYKRDQGGDVPSKGALAYYHRALVTCLVDRCIELGRDLLSPDDWGKVFERTAQQALINYKREQQPGPDDPQ